MEPRREVALFRAAESRPEMVLLTSGNLRLRQRLRLFDLDASSGTQTAMRTPWACARATPCWSTCRSTTPTPMVAQAFASLLPRRGPGHQRPSLPARRLPAPPRRARRHRVALTPSSCAPAPSTAEPSETTRSLGVGGDVHLSPNMSRAAAPSAPREAVPAIAVEAGPRVATLAAHAEPAHRHASVNTTPSQDHRLPHVPAHPRPEGERLLVISDTLMKRRIDVVERRSTPGGPRYCWPQATSSTSARTATCTSRGDSPTSSSEAARRSAWHSVRRLATTLPGVLTARTQVVQEQGDDYEVFSQWPMSARRARRRALSRLLRLAERPRRIRSSLRRRQHRRAAQVSPSSPPGISRWRSHPRHQLPARATGRKSSCATLERRATGGRARGHPRRLLPARQPLPQRHATRLPAQRALPPAAFPSPPSSTRPPCRARPVRSRAARRDHEQDLPLRPGPGEAAPRSLRPRAPLVHQNSSIQGRPPTTSPSSASRGSMSACSTRAHDGAPCVCESLRTTFVSGLGPRRTHRAARPFPDRGRLSHLPADTRDEGGRASPPSTRASPSTCAWAPSSGLVAEGRRTTASSSWSTTSCPMAGPGVLMRELRTLYSGLRRGQGLLLPPSR